MPNSTITTTEGTTRTNGGYVLGNFSVTQAINSARAQFEEQEIDIGLEIGKKREELVLLMKKKHLNKMERDFTHNPKPDFIQTGKGEVCRSTSVLEVRDLVESIRMK